MGVMQRFKGKVKASLLYLGSGATEGLWLNAGTSFVKSPNQWTNAGPPTSGGAGTFVNYAQPSDLLVDTINHALYINAGTLTSPTWSPITGGGAAIGAPKNTVISTVGAGVLTAAGITGGVITRSGSTAVFTDTTDTAANIIAALADQEVGAAFLASIVNTTAFAETISAGAGVTLSGLSAVIPGNATADFLVTYSGAGAVTMQCIRIVYNAAGGFDPNNVQTQFGSGTGTFNEEGNISRQISAAGVNPGATGADNVLAVFSIPANSFDVAGRGVAILAQGSFAANGNTKRCKIIVNPATAVVGSTVGTGGTTICDTGAVTNSGGGWSLDANIFKYGANGSNTQLGLHQAAQVGAAVAAMLAPSLITATESGAVLVAITGNATTMATDIVFNFLEVNAMN